MLTCLDFTVKFRRSRLPKLSFHNPFEIPSSISIECMLWSSLRSLGITWPTVIKSWRGYPIISTQRTLFWTWSHSSSATSSAVLCIYSFISHINWVGPYISSLLYILETLEDGDVNLILLFPSFSQSCIETMHCFHQILRSNFLPTFSSCIFSPITYSSYS